MSTGQRLYQLEQGSASRPRTGRPVVHATRGVVSSGHYLTSMAGMRMLMSGGNAIDAMVAAHVVRLIKPFHGGSKQEIVSRPKCYAFDTGFVAFGRGWEQIRDEDRGILWEHLVLDSLLMRFHG